MHGVVTTDTNVDACGGAHFEPMPDTDSCGAFLPASWEARHLRAMPLPPAPLPCGIIAPRTIDLDALASRLYVAATLVIVAGELTIGMTADEMPFRDVVLLLGLFAGVAAVLLIAGQVVRSIHSRRSRRSRNAV